MLSLSTFLYHEFSLSFQFWKGFIHAIFSYAFDMFPAISFLLVFLSKFSSCHLFSFGNGFSSAPPPQTKHKLCNSVVTVLLLYLPPLVVFVSLISVHLFINFPRNIFFCFPCTVILLVASSILVILRPT